MGIIGLWSWRACVQGYQPAALPACIPREKRGAERFMLAFV
jgi:hypothetical protein